jgi:hypothetical protein
MKIALAVLVIALLALAWRLNSVNAMLTHQQQVLGEQQQQIQILTKGLADNSTREALTLQTPNARRRRGSSSPHGASSRAMAISRITSTRN